MADESANKTGFLSGLTRVKDTIGKYATCAGWLIFPFFGVAAGIVIAPVFTAAASVSNGAVLTSFWAPLFNNPITGGHGLVAAFESAVQGYAALGTGAYNVVSSGVAAAFDPAVGIVDAVQTAWGAPIYEPS
jgi:hypothetical protein